MQPSSINPKDQTPLTVNNFFKYFITKPWSKHLGTSDKVKAWLASGALALFCFIPQIICRCFLYDKTVKTVTVKNPDADPKTEEVRKNKLNTRSPSPTQPPISSPRGKPEPSPQPNPQISFKPITSIVIDANHPLNQPQDLFFPEERAARASGNHDAAPECFGPASFPSYIENFQNCSLMDWLRDKQLKITGIDDKQSEALKQRIDARLTLLNQTVQLEERLEALRKEDLKMIDLELPWEKSGLMIALMNDKEFNRLPLVQIRELHPRQLQQVKIRLATPQEDDVISLGYYNSSMTLREFSHLHRDIINANLKTIDPLLMDFLTKKQIEGLATQDLSKEQFDVLFPVNNQNVMTYRLQLLDKGQVEGCLSTDWMDEKHMRALSANQMKSLDLSKVKDELFNALFRDAGEGRENSSRIKDLDLEKQIYPHIDLFKGTQLRTLSSDQIKSLDLKRIRKEHFDVIFPRNSDLTKTRIGELVLKQVCDGWEYFDPERLSYISPSVLKAINFTDFKLDKEKFNALFPAQDRVRLNQLEPKQVYQLLPLFDTARLANFKPEKILEFDLTQFEGRLHDLFNLADEYRSNTRALMQRLDVKKHIYPMWEEWNGGHLYHLSRDQLQQLDFSKHPLKAEQFNSCFPANNCGNIKHLEISQLLALEKHLDRVRLARINVEHVPHFDLTTLPPALMEGIFKVENADPTEQSRMTNSHILAISDAQITSSWAKLPDWLKRDSRLEGRAKRLGVIG